MVGGTAFLRGGLAAFFAGSAFGWGAVEAAGWEAALWAWGAAFCAWAQRARPKESAAMHCVRGNG